MRSGVGAAWPLTLPFFLDFEEAFFFLVDVEEVCAAPGWPAPDTMGAALIRSAAPKMYSKVRLLMGSNYGSGTGTFPARETIPHWLHPYHRSRLNNNTLPAFDP